MQRFILLGSGSGLLASILFDALATKRPMHEKALPFDREIISGCASMLSMSLLKILKEKSELSDSFYEPPDTFLPMILEVLQSRVALLKRVDLEEAPNIMGVGHVARQM